MIWIIKRLYKTLEKNSWEGMAENMKSRKRKIRWKWLYLLDKKFVGLGYLLKRWVELEGKIDKVGLPEVSREIFEELGMKITVSKNIDKWVSGERGVIFLGLNHESIIEPILAYAVLKRKDISLISGKTFMRLGKNFAKNVLPVMQRKYAWNFDRRSIVSIHGMLYRAENLSMEDINQINLGTFDKAADKLRKNQGIIIFTMGGNKMNGKWGRGIEEIIKRISREKRKEIDIVPLYFSGLNRMDIFSRLRRAALKKTNKRTELKVKVGEILNLAEAVKDENNLEGGVFANWLRQKYLMDFGFLRASKYKR
jgi:hypothetical protein